MTELIPQAAGQRRKEVQTSAGPDFPISAYASSSAANNPQKNLRICGLKIVVYPEPKLSVWWLLAALSVGVHPALAQVTNLGIAPAGNQSMLFWPATVVNSVLLSTTNLASPNWMTVSDAVPVTAVAVNNTFPARFFPGSERRGRWNGVYSGGNFHNGQFNNRHRHHRCRPG